MHRNLETANRWAFRYAYNYCGKLCFLIPSLLFPLAGQADTSWNACSIANLTILPTIRNLNVNELQKPSYMLSARVLCSSPVYEIRVTVTCASMSEMISFDATMKQRNWDIWMSTLGTAECEVRSEGLS